MEFWIATPFSGRVTTPDLIRKIALEVESLGLTGITLGDHLAVPRANGDRHGYTFEALMTLSHVAAITSRIKLGTAMVVAPLRNAVLLAKQVATLDQLSGGRVSLGLAAGYIEGEFTNLGADFHRRGAVLEETVELLRHLFHGDGSAFAGDLYRLDDYVVEPRPVQDRLPIVIGALQGAALDRAARLADVWSAPLEFDQWKRAADEIRERSAKLDRTVQLACELRWGTNVPGEAMPGIQIRGDSPAAMQEDIARFRDAGCERVTIGFGPTAEYQTVFIPKLRYFAEEVAQAFQQPTGS